MIAKWAQENVETLDNMLNNNNNNNNNNTHRRWVVADVLEQTVVTI